MIFDTLDNFDLLRCYTLVIVIPWEALIAVLNTRNPWRQPQPHFSLEHRYLTVPQWISMIGISITQLLCIGCLSCLTFSYPAAHPSIDPSSYFTPPLSSLCHHLMLPLLATFSAKNTHSPTSDSLSYPVSDSVS